MAKFRFNLEAVLTQRKAQEREKQLALAVLERQRADLEEQVRACQRSISEERRELRDQLGAGSRVDLRGVRFQAATSLKLVVKAQHAVIQIAGVQKRIEAARAELLEAAKRRRAVELLREKRFEAWREEQKALDQAATDELAVIAGNRTEDAA